MCVCVYIYIYICIYICICVICVTCGSAAADASAPGVGPEAGAAPGGHTTAVKGLLSALTLLSGDWMYLRGIEGGIGQILSCE